MADLLAPIRAYATQKVQSAVSNATTLIAENLKTPAVPIAPGGKTAPPAAAPAAPADHRARIHAFDSPQAKDYLYGPRGGIMDVLHQTDGVIFPYTPTINIVHAITYEPISLTHANQDIFSWTRAGAVEIQVVGRFTCQNDQERRYLLAVIHFLRTMGKMRFGEKDPEGQRGMPPPLVMFSAWGNLMFNKIPAVITNFSIDMPGEIDYVRYRPSFSSGGTSVLQGEAWMPAMMEIHVYLKVQKTPKQLRSDFDWKKFQTGELLLDRTKGGGGWW